jgi:hypothetical protein
MLAVYAPPLTEDSALFLALAKDLRAQDIRTPTIFAVELDRGFLLLENLGNNLVFDMLDPASADGLYRQSMGVLAQLRKVKPEHLQREIPVYDEDWLRMEMALCDEWFFNRYLGVNLDNEQKQVFQEFCDIVIQNALSQVQCFVHRDFHSKNLILCDDNSVGVIDFQGAMYGPAYYDLASLLKDCYIDWPRNAVEDWVLAFAAVLNAEGLIDDSDKGLALRNFDLIALQRHIKVLGIFARLSLRDNKHHYLEHIPRVLNYVHESLAMYPEFSMVKNLFESLIINNMRAQGKL